MFVLRSMHNEKSSGKKNKKSQKDCLPANLLKNDEL